MTGGTLLLGAVADDFAGATDLANMLVAGGLQVVQLIGVPADDDAVPEADAIVVALKSRTAPAADAVSQSRAALRWLRRAGARQFYFKFCSTFDSTDQGNIGPVADALLDELGADFTITCPAYPTHARTVYKGHLFVGDVLLSQSGMQDHPLTPMRDANLVAVLSRQTPHPVGLVDHTALAQGAGAVAQEFERLAADGIRHAVVDAVSDIDLITIAAAAADLALVTGGAGVALGLPAVYRKRGLLATNALAALPTAGGRPVVLSGSCSLATQAQVARARAHWPVYDIDPLQGGVDEAAAFALDWYAEQAAETPVVFSSTAPADQIARVHEKLGAAEAGQRVEKTMARIASTLKAHGSRRFIIAGGEVSGAVVQALGVRQLRIGPEIDPGVPWTESLSDPVLALALKSGNFGAEDFFRKAVDMLP